MNIFELLHEEFKFDINKPIRLFEAFSGYGSQQMALKRLGVNIEVVGYSEIDKYAIQTYEALHGKHKNYGGIGSFERLPKDIDICTWSFPCQDISIAGRQRGMTSGSRSNYGYVFLDTVENTPYNERPKVLLMENVRALFSETFKDDWREIQIRLEKLGYTSYADILNAKDYGVAQNRERVFIVSILGNYYYEFPKPYILTKRLKDYLENEVDDKYYLSDTQVKQIQSWKAQRDPLKDAKTVDDDILQTITAKSNTSMNSSMILLKLKNGRYRKFTPKELLRFMDVNEHDIDIILNEVSDTQAYKLAGNSIVVNVLVEIFRKLFI